ncbi:uncharacterized protein ACRADG_006758 [Cochliomyia hominivorax]
MCMFVGSSSNKKYTSLMKNKVNEIFLRRSKRYLVFEKGATLTFQGNIAKSIISPAPRGLNIIAEYTLSYELPSDFQIFKNKPKKTTKISISTTPHPSFHPYQMVVPYNHDYYFSLEPEFSNPYLIERKYSYFHKNMPPTKCFKRYFYDYKGKISNICHKRRKRDKILSVNKLTVSQRMFYDLIEKWSLIHGFLPRYCFMRTLCESFELLLPYGQSLLHDIIHIFLRYTKTWAFHHNVFGRSLKQQYTIDDCAKLYGPHCRVSWLDFITKLVYGTRANDFMH